MKNEVYKSLSQEGFFSGGMKGFIKGLVVSCILTFILLAISALIITYSPVSEDISGAFSFICVIVSALIGGSVAAKSAVSRGFLKGAATGVCYVLLLYIIASLVSDKFIVNSHTALLFFIGAVAGAIGGIAGINSGRKRKR